MASRVRALFVPCGALDPVRVVTLTVPRFRTIEELVGGYPERVQYDVDAEGYIDSEGRLKHRTANERANDYIWHRSRAAELGNFVDADEGYGLYGDVVFTGTDLTSVPDRLLKEFGQPLGREVAL